MMLRVLAVTGILCATLASVVAMLAYQGEMKLPQAPQVFAPTAETIQRGAYLATAGNCMSCHSTPGGAPYSGGAAIATPFGTVYSSNLTPDARTGIGAWNADHFWRAMHNGRSKDGRLLYPAFPYPNYTLVSREDSDAIFAFLRSLPAVEQARPEHALRFPYNTQAALAVWRALFFKPKLFEREGAQTAEWNRGAYLVRGLTHCAACHGERNLLGATQLGRAFAGARLPDGWYAPSLVQADEAGVAHWSKDEIIALLKTGRTNRGSTLGPMAEVVFRSTQFLSDEDIGAMATFLQSLPQETVDRTVGAKARAEDVNVSHGAFIYRKQCADCHGEKGEGREGAFIALAGNRAVMLDDSANVIRVVLMGGYLPATAGNPRPHGMPPFTHILNDADIAAVTTYIRNAWGNRAPPVSPIDVMRAREQR